jgi:hypothetical protein
MGTIKTGNNRPYGLLSPKLLLKYIIETGLLEKPENLDDSNDIGINLDFITADLYMDIPDRINDEIIDKAYDLLDEYLKNSKIEVSLATY